jgi:Tfp pilus assembly protein PilF
MSRFSHYSEDNSMSLFIKLRIEEGSGDIEEAKKYGDLLLTRYPNSPEAKKYQNNDY